MIYFVQIDEPGGLVKIGYTLNYRQRIMWLRSVTRGKPLKLLGMMEGRGVEEAAMHKQFEHCHAVGEWFRPEDDLISFAKSLPPFPETAWDGRLIDKTRTLIRRIGVNKVAAALNVSRQAVSQWDLIPVTRAKKFEEAFKVPAQKLRPDIFGSPILHLPRKGDTV